MSLLTQAVQAWRRVGAELAANARLRTGAWLVLALALLSLVLLQAERVQAAYADYTATAERLQRAGAVLGREDWPQLLAAERAVHEKIDALLWQAESEGLAQARLQAVLGDMVANVGIRNARVRSGVSQPLPELPTVWRVQMRISGNCEPAVALRLLHDLAKHPQKLVADRLDYIRSNSRLTVLVSGYFSLRGASPSRTPAEGSLAPNSSEQA